MKRFHRIHGIIFCLVLQTCSSGAPTSPNEIPGFDNHMGAGDSAKDLLTDDSFNKIIIEIQPVDGFEPTDQTKTNLKNFALARLHKSSVDIVVDTPISSPGQSPYSIDDVQQIEAENRKFYTSVDEKKLVVYFLFLNGKSDQDSNSGKILGIAHQNTSLVIFEETIQSISGGLTQPSTETVESTVAQHEFGHLMGLVNIGTPLSTSHQDSAHGAHCSHQTCLMYYAAETSDLVANLIGDAVPELDSDCLADLQANGGK